MPVLLYAQFSVVQESTSPPTVHAPPMSVTLVPKAQLAKSPKMETHHCALTVNVASAITLETLAANSTVKTNASRLVRRKNVNYKMPSSPPGLAQAMCVRVSKSAPMRFPAAAAVNLTVIRLAPMFLATKLPANVSLFDPASSW